MISLAHTFRLSTNKMDYFRTLILIFFREFKIEKGRTR